MRGQYMRSTHTSIVLNLAALVLAATPVDAHCFSRWYYPWPQRCGAARQMVRGMPRSPLHVRSEAPFASEAKPPSLREAEIPLPSLARADCDGGEADEAIRAKVLLRAALEASHGH